MRNHVCQLTAPCDPETLNVRVLDKCDSQNQAAGYLPLKGFFVAKEAAKKPICSEGKAVFTILYKDFEVLF